MIILYNKQKSTQSGLKTWLWDQKPKTIGSKTKAVLGFSDDLKTLTMMRPEQEYSE